MEKIFNGSLPFSNKSSWDYVISYFLSIASTDYISWIFNGMRQFTAVAITVMCFPWIVEKK